VLINRSGVYSSTRADKVRQYVVKEYIRPARVRGERMVSVTAGDVHKALGLKNRIALVCTALRATRFQSENHLRLKDVSGPPSGMSTTVKFTYEIVPGETGGESQPHPFWALRGIAKGMFEKPGEWEESIRKDREHMTDVYDKISR
jgi:hypothetical protein